MFVMWPTSHQDAADWNQTNLGTWLDATGCRSAEGTLDTQNESNNPAHSFHAETRLRSGEPVIVLDTGSVGNIGGDEWSLDVATHASQHGRKNMVKQVKRDRPLSISGVGQGSQECKFNCHLPVALERINGEFSKGTIEIPTVKDSPIPGLLGLKAMRAQRAIIDTSTLQIHFVGPGDYNLGQTLPPGTETFQCVLTPSGHMALPCGKFVGLDAQEQHGGLQMDSDLALQVTVQPSQP